jgi:acyl-CoA synthetase (AMP-forming)/AMP-acid ligase II
VPCGEDGELAVDAGSEGAFAGYWNDPEKTAERLRDGWYYTGDAFRHDEDGNFFLVGRLDDVFRSGAESIQPLEVEVVLGRHPAIADVAVVGTPDERLGETVTAVIVARTAGLTIDSINQYCLESELANFMRPRRVVLLDAIPRNPAGKVVRRDLTALVVGLLADADWPDLLDAQAVTAVR